MDPNQVILQFRFSSFGDSTLHKMNLLRQQRRFCDVTVRIDKLEVPGHKVVFAAGSSFLRDQFILQQESREVQINMSQEAEVGRHCGDVANHSFQRFVCGHCPQKFFKESTVRRHCRSEHGGERVAVAYFCGLCDSMQFEREEEFTEHYERLHSKDYYRVDDHGGGGSAAGGARSGEHGSGDDAPTQSESPAAPSPCPCMGSEKGDDERKASFTRCVKKLSAEGRCRYVCAPCAVTVASFARIKTHVATTHPGLNLAKTFDVVCSACLETFESVPTFHEHFHSEHCLLAPCRGRGRSAASTPDSIPDALEVKPDLKGKSPS
jgi:hypothetical protein